VIAESFERIHRGNLVRVGVMPAQIDVPSGSPPGIEDRLDLKVDILFDSPPAGIRPPCTVRIKAGETSFFCPATLLAVMDIEMAYLAAGGLFNIVSANLKRHISSKGARRANP
jgi:aconitase A